MICPVKSQPGVLLQEPSAPPSSMIAVKRSTCRQGIVLLGGAFENKGRIIGHRIVLPVPVENKPGDSAAQRIGHLPVHLIGITGCVPDAHMVRLTEPTHEMRINLGAGPGVEQRARVHLAHVCRADIPIRLSSKGWSSACVVGRLCGKSGRGCHSSSSRSECGQKETGEDENAGRHSSLRKDSR